MPSPSVVETIRTRLAPRLPGAVALLDIADCKRRNLYLGWRRVDADIREAFSADGGSGRTVERALHQAEIRERVRSALVEEQAAKWLVERATTSEEAKASEEVSTAAEAEPSSEPPAPELQEQHP